MVQQGTAQIGTTEYTVYYTSWVQLGTIGYTWVRLGIGRGEMRVTRPNRGANAQAVPQECTFKSDYNVYISSASHNNAH